MSAIVPGQRWLSDAEPSLGLGTLMEIDGRRLTLHFPAADETRTYAAESAPLTRAAFTQGDRLRGLDGTWITVDQVDEHGGLFTYHGQSDAGAPVTLPEQALDPHMQMNRPAARLFAGQLDPNPLFELRRTSRELLAQIARTPINGLIGGRTALIPHQLYIAHEVARRHAPRVLLADEVGLGKTIEAGLILHHQLHQERARRVLLLLPETLQHQWLVEMVRRFNLRFSLFDLERAMQAQADGYANPFHSEQLVITSLDLLLDNPALAAAACNGEWDLLVVDEAHHLEWHPEAPSPEYLLVDRLAQTTPGVLLLTATPEQLGRAGHFARLRLLDPARFPDLDRFHAEERSYAPVADAARRLLDGEPLDDAARITLAATLDEGDNQRLLDALDNPEAPEALRHAAREALTAHLLDRHGTGRVLFRNTRAAVQGFPAREPHIDTLPLPDDYELFTTSLTPERAYTKAAPADAEAWWRFDPRVAWLVNLLGELRPAKVLLIAARAESVLELAEALRTRHGIDAALFHEGLSIVERDRAAAYFADPDGSRLLLCSEIGSEGRNFQFAHHLVLFDLPRDPDLLEQRIGRLDRIGQRESVRIHLPLLEGSAGAALADWYHQGLDALRHTCATGHVLAREFTEQLGGALGRPSDALARSTLIEATRVRDSELRAALAEGRDRLLELNSCRPGVAEQLTAAAQTADDPSVRTAYLDLLCETYGVEQEEDGAAKLILRPDTAMQQSLPGLPEDGLHATLYRDAALADDAIAFLSWSHPLMHGALERITTEATGNVAFCTLSHPNLKPGTLLLEALFLVEASAPRHLARHLPAGYIRLLLDSTGKELAAQVPSSTPGKALDKAVAHKVLTAYGKPLRTLLESAERQAAERAPALITASRQQAEQELGEEVARLRALAVHNPNVRQSEIDALVQELAGVNAALDQARLRLDALRVVITS